MRVCVDFDQPFTQKAHFHSGGMTQSVKTSRNLTKAVRSDEIRITVFLGVLNGLTTTWVFVLGAALEGSARSLLRRGRSWLARL